MKYRVGFATQVPIAALLLLLAACATNGTASSRPDVPPLAAEALQRAKAAPDVKEVTALGGTFSSYKIVGDLLHRAADAGNPVALTQLGDRYRRNGNTPAADLGTAVGLYRRAAQQGYAPAEVALGKVYRLGQGVKRDKAEAAYWYRQAAEQKDPEGMLLYGIALLGGEGVVQDRPRAMALITADGAAEKNGSAASASDKTAATPTIMERARKMEMGSIRLRILASVGAGKELSPAEIDKIARDAAGG